MHLLQPPRHLRPSGTMLQMPRGRRHTDPPSFADKGIGCAGAEAGGGGQGACQVEGVAEAAPRQQGTEGDIVQPCVSRVARQWGAHSSLEESAEIMRVVGFESRWVALCVSGRSDDFCTPHEGSWDDLSGGALMSQPLRESVGPGYVVKHFRGRPHKKFCTSSIDFLQ